MYEGEVVNLHYLMTNVCHLCCSKHNIMHFRKSPVA